MTTDKRPDNFLGIPPEFSTYRNSEAVILPLPFDKTCSWLSGTSRGPRGLIEASKNLELYDIETQTEAYRRGIFTADAIEAEDGQALNKAAYERVKELLKDEKFVISVGGEHSVSYGPIKAHAEKYPKMSVLQLDAHTDLRESYEGNPYSHACIMARAKEMVDRVVAVGIRAMDRSELVNVDSQRIFFAEHIRLTPNWIENVLAQLTDDVYITLDVDVFDIGIMPSTGTPEPGGLGWYDVITLLRAAVEQKNVVGFDIVELAPNEANPAPDFMAAKVVYKLLSYREALRESAM